MNKIIGKIKKIINNLNNDHTGGLLLFAMIFGTISLVVIIGGVSSYAIHENKASLHKHNREQAFQIAEAGINYYRWHLAHDKEDFYDGQGATSTGPYVHGYENKDGEVIGYYSLNINSPATGTTVVVIESTGWLKKQPESKRKIKARVGFRSLTDYAFLTNTDVWIGNDETTSGKMHANGGIRYDGTANAPITSAVESYNCESFHGCGSGQTKPGVWGQGGPESYWEYPVPAVDFSEITSKLAEIKNSAQSNGIYLTSSGYQGWRIRFNPDGKIKIRKVKSCKSYKGADLNDHWYHWYCIDIHKETGTEYTYDMPENGYIYVEDTVWVDGTVNGRATIGTANGESIIINGDITYLSKNGSHALGLMAQKDVLVPHNSPNELEVNAAMLAQTGATKRYYYPGDKKDNLYTYGSIVSNGLWTWSWVSGGGAVMSGYRNTHSNYDANLTYNPPPGFPVGNEYELISWEEIEIEN